MKEVEFVIPKELDNMTLLTTVVSPVKQDLGILIMGENLETQDGLPTIRIYLAEQYESEFQVEVELEAFAFNDTESAMQFVISLPEMSALELLLIMYGLGVPESNVFH